MTAHFSLAEFTRSDIATRRGIDNTLPAALEPAALATLGMLERVRAALSEIAGKDVAVVLSSGYRCPALNAAVGSSLTSDHPKASAADFTAPAFGTPFEVCTALAPLVVGIAVGQLIHEVGDWVHVSTRIQMLPINRVITISHAGTVPGIKEV